MSAGQSRFTRYRPARGWFGYYLTVVCRHWILFFPTLVVVPLAVAGGLGRSLGIQYLFRDQKSPFDGSFDGQGTWWMFGRLLGSAYFETQGYAVALAGLLWTCSLLLEERNDAVNRTYLPEKARFFHYMPGVILLGIPPLLAALGQLFLQILTEGKLPWHMLLLPLGGYVSGIVFFYAMSTVAFKMAGTDRSKIGAVLLLSCLVILLAVRIPVILPAKLLFVVLAAIVVIHTSLQLATPTWRVGIVVAVITATIGLNTLRSEKYSFPGLDQYYATELEKRPTLRSYFDDNRRITTPEEMNRRQAMTCNATNNQPVRGLIDPIISLQNWYRHVSPAGDQSRSQPRLRPKLVIVATSGGAYRASYWTARVLEMLLDGDRQGGVLPGFRSSIRLLTGASGGMVGSAYFAVGDPLHPDRVPLAEQIRDDVRSALDNRASWMHPFSSVVRNPMTSDWDSLSAVARQMVISDTPGLFWPFERRYDRGRELERHWKRLDKTFGALREDEAKGLRPSLVVTPTLADTGLPLLISNLDLDSLYHDKKEGVELFKLLPGAQDKLKVQTAIRMSATFPFISPGTRLPMNPPYRVVDAGYYDNFGIGVAVAYLSEPAIKSWLKLCTSGVMVVQIRAWPQDGGDTPPPAPSLPSSIWKAVSSLDWLTTPIEGVANARATTNFYRNRRELCELEDLYRDASVGRREASGNACQDEKDFLQTVEFEPERLNEDATFTWDLQPHELEQMTALLTAPNIGNARAALAKFWKADLR